MLLKNEEYLLLMKIKNTLATGNVSVRENAAFGGYRV